MSEINHIAFLVGSAEASAEVLRRNGVHAGPPQNFEGEGTREMYAGGEELGCRILLMQAIGEGPYKRALVKRGPGLHHIAVDVPSLEEFLSGLASSGWLLHPASVKTMAASRTAYLARPGMPMLIEVQERAGITRTGQLVRSLTLPLPPEAPRLLAALGLAAGQIAPGPAVINLAAGPAIPVPDLLA